MRGTTIKSYLRFSTKKEGRKPTKKIGAKSVY